MRPGPPIAVVIVTCDRREELLRTLGTLAVLPERPPVVVVDNGSTDGTAQAVVREHPGTTLVCAGRDRGPAARNLGVAATDADLIAFSDDDSTWHPGSLDRAVAAFAAHPRLGLLAARILVGAEGRLDPTCRTMAESPLPRAPDLPGPSVLGFVACAAVVRRDAFLRGGGFPGAFGFGGEETPVALALRDAGWGLAYVDSVVAHHYPSAVRDADGRRRSASRNDLLLPWMRMPVDTAVVETARLLHRSGYAPSVLRSLATVAGLVARHRKDRVPVGRQVVAEWRSVYRRRSTVVSVADRR